MREKYVVQYERRWMSREKQESTAVIDGPTTRETRPIARYKATRPSAQPKAERRTEGAPPRPLSAIPLHLDEAKGTKKKQAPSAAYRRSVTTFVPVNVCERNNESGTITANASAARL